MVKNKNKYYWLTWSAKNEDNTKIAYAPSDTPLAHELVSKVSNMKELPFDFELKSVKVDTQGLSILNDNEQEYVPVDYLPNSLAWPLMSNKMRDVINGLLMGTEKVEWVKAKIKTKEQTFLYFIPVFKTKLNTLDINKTMFVPNTDHIIKPVFNYRKASKYLIFHGHSLFWQITSEIYVSNLLKLELLKKSLSGIQFQEIKMC